MALVSVVFAVWFAVGLVVIVRRRAWAVAAASVGRGLLLLVGWIPWLRGRSLGRLDALARSSERP